MNQPESLNEYFNQNYNKLVKYASRFTNDPHDLVHFIYIKSVDAGFEYRNKPSTDWYFKLGIKQSSYSDFKKLYTNDHVEFVESRMEVEVDSDHGRRVMFEVVDEQVRFLKEFDRHIVEIYLRGENMKALSRETEIPYQTIQSSIKRSIGSIKKAVHKRLEDGDENC